MADGPTSGILHWLRKLARSENENRPDRDLVGRFAQDGDETAFTLLVQRHGPMVYGVCSRLLHQGPDADDAFQATFLILARKASSIRNESSVSGWLHGVARRVAANQRRKNARERRLEMLQIPICKGTEPDAVWAELRTVLDEELAKLPEGLRLPLILCYLDGKTHNEAAQELGWSESTLRGRLERGRNRLRLLLTSRGWTLSVGGLGVVLAEKMVGAAVAGDLVHRTVQAAVAYLGGCTAGVLSAKAVEMAEGVLQMMWHSKVKTALVVLFVVIISGSSLGWAMHHALAGRGENAHTEQGPKDAPPSNPAKNAKYFIYVVQTDLQRELIPAKSDVFVLLDTTAIFDRGKVALSELKLLELREQLLARKKANAKLHFTLFYKRGDGNETDQQEVLRYAMIGFGHEAGFAKVTADGSYQNTDRSWKELSATFAGKSRDAKGDESAPANDLVRTYPVNTELSRYLTSGADCAVVVVGSLENDKGTIPQKVRVAIIDTVNKLKLTQKKRISFFMKNIDASDNERRQLLSEFVKLANDMKFDTCSVTFR